MAVNRILTNKDREEYKDLIEEMFRVIPDQMGRKISEANIQQAFVLGEVLKLLPSHSRILSVGCFEDTAYEYLMNTPYKEKLHIVGIDPALNQDLKSYLQSTNNLYDIVFATSVIEHVKNDLEFLEGMCKLLNDGGYGILTTDFKDDYKLGDPLPYSDEKFYTKQDLEVGFKFVLDRMNCELVDEPDYTDKDNFVYQGHQYSFATFVFKKKSNV